MIAQRVLAVVSAVMLVAAVALATFGSQTLSLGQFLLLVDHDVLDYLPRWAGGLWGGNWAWTSIIQPLLIRPAWLLPASAGLIFVGLSLSVPTGKSTHRSHRRS